MGEAKRGQKQIKRHHCFSPIMFIQVHNMKHNSKISPVSHIASFNFFPPTVTCLILKSTPKNYVENYI